MILQPSLFFFPLLLSAVITGTLAFLGWRNRENAIALPFAILMAASTFWTICYAIQLISADLATNLLTTTLSYFGIVTVPVMWLILVLWYTGRENYITRRNVLLLFAVPALVVVMVATNQYHHLYYSAIVPEIFDGSVVWAFQHGPLFWIQLLYAYLLVLAALVLVASRFSGAPPLYRKQILILFIASGIPLVANLLYVISFNPVPGLDLTPFTFTISGLMVALGTFRYQLFSLMPVAYPWIFSTISDGIIIIDTRNRIRDLNPAACRIAGSTAQILIGTTLVESLPQLLPAIEEKQICAREIRTEIQIPLEGSPRYYDIACRRLHLLEGAPNGHMIILRDITEQRKMRDALTMVNKKLNLLTGITRHDILNKITALQGYIELAEGEEDQCRVPRYLPRMKEIIQAIQEELVFTRDYEEIGVNMPAWQDVSRQIRRARDLVDKKGLKVTDECAGLEIFADPLLHKVISNLMENTVRHGETATAIRFWCEQQGETLVLLCSDDGVGVPLGDKEKIFRRGFGNHTGLGLFLSREILSITGITIRESGVPGKGARFEILVPKGTYRFVKSPKP